MLTEYFPKLTDVKGRLYEILNEELQRRSELDFLSPKETELNLVLEETEFGGSPESSDDKTVLSLNVLNEVSQDPELNDKYGAELKQIDSWIVKARPIVAPGRINVIDNLLVDCLFHPEKFESVDVSSLGTSGKIHYLEAKGGLMENAPKIKQYLETKIVPGVLNSDLGALRSTIRHELEHLNPKYKSKIDAMHVKEKIYLAEFEKYKSGSGERSIDWIRLKAREYLTEASILIPNDEVRAYFCQFFDSENDSKETLDNIRNGLEKHIIDELLPNRFVPSIFTIVAKQFFMEYSNRGETFDMDTLKYVENIFYQGSRFGATRIESSKVDHKLADSLARQVSHWEYKFREGIMNALNEVYDFYCSKSKG